MSKADFIDQVAKKGDLSTAEATRVVDLVLDSIEEGIKKSRGEGSFTIGTFGVFTISQRKARMGRNPRTGEAIKIKASKSLRFRPALRMKKAAGA